MAPGFALVKHDSNFFTDFKVSAKIIYILGERNDYGEGAIDFPIL